MSTVSPDHLSSILTPVTLPLVQHTYSRFPWKEKQVFQLCKSI